MMALPFVLPLLFVAGFCVAYILLLVVNALFALVDGYRRRPAAWRVPLKAMAIIASVFAALVCIWLLCNIDGRFT